MRCDDARLALWPEPGPRPASPEIVAAFEHYAGCDACQRFFRVQRGLGARLERLRSGVLSPDGLRDRTLAALDAEVAAARVQRRARRLAGVGAGLLAAAAVVLLVVRAPAVPPEVALPLVAEARLPLGAADAMTGSDLEEAERWLEARVGYDLIVPDITDATLMGARVIRLAGTTAAAAVYTLHGKPLTYFALPSSDLMGRRVSGTRVVAASADGYEVALWSELGQARAVVAPMPRQDVVAIARECRNKALMLRTS